MRFGLIGASVIVLSIGSVCLAQDNPIPTRQSVVDLIPALSPGAASTLRVCEQQRDRSERDVLVLAHAEGEADAEVKTLQKQIEMYQTTIKGKDEEAARLAEWWQRYITND